MTDTQEGARAYALASAPPSPHPTYLRRTGFDRVPEPYAIAQQGPNVAIFTAARTPEREALGFSFVGPVTTRKHALFARANDARHYRSLADLRNERPVIAGMCRYESLVDGTLTMVDISIMNDALDVRADNEYLAAEAAERERANHG